MPIPMLNDIEITGDITQTAGSGNLNINKNEIQQAVVQNLATEPATPSAGQIIHNTAKTDAVKGNGKFGYRTASSWVYPDMEKSVYDTNNDGKVNSADDSDKLGGQNSAYHLNRANHTGTQLSSTISDFAEASQDAVGGALTDTNSIDFTYDDAGNKIKADLRLNGADLRIGASGVDLNTSGVTTGTYTKLTVNTKGIVTAGTSLVSGDLPAHNHTASQITDLATTVKNYKLNEFGAPTADVSLNSKKITNLADPVSGTDAANKNYVDNAVAGFTWKNSVKCATTANITLSGNQTIDGISVTAGMRVLVKNQTTASHNGVYVSSASTWSRATDLDAWAELVSAAIFVEQGTTQADTAWVCTSDAGGTLGSTAVTWVQFTGAAQIIAGSGLNKTGNTLSVEVDGFTIKVDSNKLTAMLKSNGGLAYDASGMYVAVDNSTIELVGGSLAIKSAFKRQVYTAQITGNSSTTSFTITHSLGTKNVLINVYEDSTGYDIVTLTERDTINSIKVHFKVAPATGKKYNVVVMS